jgi:hypothetical protein
VGKPDVSAHGAPPNDLFAGSRHFGHTNFVKEARLYHADREYTSNIFLKDLSGKRRLIINQNAIFCA